jgi:lipopolysaccharide biosynthesis regulator YciM
MKLSFFMTVILGLITLTGFAQKKEVDNAQGEYTKYQTLKGNKAMGTLALTSLNNAKTSIDKAAAFDKTATLPLTLALKGSIYASLAFNDTVAATSTPLFITAEESLKKAKEADVKGENKKMLDDAYQVLGYYQLNKGVKEYTSKKYDLAYKSFDYYRQIAPTDTTGMYYTGLAAANYDNWDAAIENYQRLLTSNYSRKESVYQDLANFYLNKKDTTDAIKTLKTASEKYPSNAIFGKKEIELNLQTGKQAEVLASIESTIAKDPKNKTLYYYAGITYTQVADAINAKISALNKAAAAAAKAAPAAVPAKPAPGTKPAAGAKMPAAPATATVPAANDQITALTKSRDDNFAKAETAYKKAIEIDPNYFEANLNLGYVLINPAIDLYNAANKLPVNKQKEYDEAIAKCNALFDAAKPYLQKAVDLQPKSIDALTNLKTYYLGKKDLANANLIKKQIEDLTAAQGK